MGQYFTINNLIEKNVLDISGTRNITFVWVLQTYGLRLIPVSPHSSHLIWEDLFNLSVPQSDLLLSVITNGIYFTR